MSKAWVTLLGLVPMVVACGKNVEGPFGDQGRYEGRYAENGAPEGWGADESGQARREERGTDGREADERQATREEPGGGSPPGWRDDDARDDVEVARAVERAGRAGERAAERAGEAAEEAGQTAERAGEKAAATAEEVGEEAAATAEEAGEDVAATAEEVTEGDERQAAGDRDAAPMRRERPAIRRPTPAPPPEPAIEPEPIEPEATAELEEAAEPEEPASTEIARGEVAEGPADRGALLRSLRENVDGFRATEDASHGQLVQALHDLATMLRTSPSAEGVEQRAQRIDGYADRIAGSEPDSTQHADWARRALTQGVQSLTTLVGPLDDENLDARVRDLRARVDALPTDKPLVQYREAYGAAFEELTAVLAEIERPAPPAGTR